MVSPMVSAPPHGEVARLTALIATTNEQMELFHNRLVIVQTTKLKPENASKSSNFEKAESAIRNKIQSFEQQKLAYVAELNAACPPSWTCATCTFENNGFGTVCEACQMDKV